MLGSGVAGLICALECARSGRVVLVTKDRLPESDSRYAQGGIASVWSPDDSFEAHVADTLGAGAGSATATWSTGGRGPGSACAS